MNGPGLRVAIVGSGVAGIASAHMLQTRHEVTLIEKRPRLGGHTHTIAIESGPDAGIRVDTGFIVCNDKTYPNFHRFLKSLGVGVRYSDMSFGFWDERSGLQYAGTNLNGLFAQRTNLLRPRFLRMIREIVRFSKVALRDLEQGIIGSTTLGSYLREYGFGREFVRNYVLPMGAAIWSTPGGKMLNFPAQTFITFFRNHGLLSVKDRPRWQTVVGGSDSYIDSFRKGFRGKIRAGESIETIKRAEDSVTIRFQDSHEQTFDRVVIATHADQVLPLLEAPTEEERRIFGPWKYEANHVILHTDEKVLPPNKRAWASWNYTREKNADDHRKLSMTYHMNRLQGLSAQSEYCVTLNRKAPVEDRKIIRSMRYMHPIYSPESIEAQSQLPGLNGKSNTFFAGSYHGYGFHEDAVTSAVRVAEHFETGF